jgi:hypothetical protein
MIRIDGSFGGGGGQILRTSLSLSLATRKPLHNVLASTTLPRMICAAPAPGCAT